MNTLNGHATLVIAAFALLLSAGVGAQPSDERLVEEVVVTAQKREQYLSDVGIAVTAFSGDDVRRLGLLEPVDLAAQTPNLNI